MTKRTRLIILFVCVLLFFIIAPYILLYSVGYRVDFKHFTIVATGGIYVKALPIGANITVNESIQNTTSYFSNSVFVQNLLPGTNQVTIKKEGFHDYQKTLEVDQNQVTKLENVILFKKDIVFEELPDITQFTVLTKKAPEKFVIKNNNLYYSDAPENASLTALQKSTPLIKNIITFETSDTSLLWLGADGALYASDISGKNPQALSQVVLPILKNTTYSLHSFSDTIFLQEGSSVKLFNPTTKAFEHFYGPVNDIKISPDGQKIAYYNDHEVLYSFLNSPTANKVLLNRFSGKITDVYWLNNDYIVFVLDNKVMISEIDTRGNMNIITLPPVLKDPQIFFNQATKKLYILNQETLLVSEKLLP